MSVQAFLVLAADMRPGPSEYDYRCPFFQMRNKLMERFFQNIDDEAMKFIYHRKGYEYMCFGWHGITCKYQQITEIQFTDLPFLREGLTIQFLPPSVRKLEIT